MSRKRKNVSLYPSVKFLRSSTLKTFTSLQTGSVGNTSQNQDEDGNLSGREAKAFYETLLGESTEQEHVPRTQSSKYKRKEDNNAQKGDIKVICRSSKHKSNSPAGYSSRQVNMFLKMAQEGDIDGLQRIIRDGSQDINATDQFDWTALMCACHSQQKSCVRFLLREGARTDLRNSKGETAEDIVKNLHDSSLRNIFRKHHKRNKKSSDAQVSQVESMTSHDTSSFCEICNTQFTCRMVEHNSSTAHLFNCQFKSERTLYHIPESNVGFQMMTKTGWDKEKGLGPEGTGRKFPVKTILKKDRLGLGSKQKTKPRITHFSPRDLAAVETDKESKVKPRIAKRTSKRKRIEQKNKERNWEHNMRLYMNTD